MSDHPYDDTVDESQHRSFQKALEVFAQQQAELEAERKKSIHRPDVSVVKGVLIFFVCVVISVLAVVFLAHFLIEALWLAILAVLLFNLVVFAVFSRRILTWLIKVYQKTAPDRVRLSCVFEPTCSAYMLLSIEKFGAFRGFFKGVRRLFRCRYPNGGVDYP